jgi:aminopeptidase
VDDVPQGDRTDERVHKHAETLVEHSTGVEAGDDVLLQSPMGAEDLTEAIAESVGERGGTRHTMLRTENSSVIGRAYLEGADPDEIRTPEQTLAAAEAADVAIIVRGGRVAEFDDLPEATVAAQPRISPMSS